MAARWSGAIHARRLNKCSGGSNLWHIGGEATTVRRAGNENSRASSAMRWQKRRGSIELELSACKMVFAERPAEHIHVQLNAFHSNFRLSFGSARLNFPSTTALDGIVFWCTLSNPVPPVPPPPSLNSILFCALYAAVVAKNGLMLPFTVDAAEGSSYVWPQYP
ncbi:hypothetical protein V9T40_003941 [Parthenolecanium corni]|uniref:Uncharacterized protein n=1 Tax=Parthenolecanium corni TaxID=536013 RepID=A0AAN9TE03_9HEMI